MSNEITLNTIADALINIEQRLANIAGIEQHLAKIADWLDKQQQEARGDE